MAIYFGTVGIRGVENQDLTTEIALKCGNALSSFFENKGRVLVRASETEFKTRIMVEGEDGVVCKSIANHNEGVVLKIDKEGNC